MNQSPGHLLRLAYRTASRIVHNQLLAEEAGEQALHRLTLLLLAGEPLEKPEAWLRTAARNSACAMLRRGWARTRALDDDGLDAPLARTDAAAIAPAGTPAVMPDRDQLRALLGGVLTPRQRQALDAALSCRTMIAAARDCHMTPRDFRRNLQAISRRARRHLDLKDLQHRYGWLPAPRAG